MKRIISLALCALMLVSCFAFTACGNSNADYVAMDATDLLVEDFGIAITKGNTKLKEEVNKVVDQWVKDGTMTKYVDYYTEYAKFLEGEAEEPAKGDLKLSWDFGNATEAITVYTESGFAPFEFISNNEVIGVDIAIMSQVAVNMGKKIDVKDVLFDTIPLSVKNANGDAVGAAGLTIDADRLEMVDFSNVYYSSTLVVVSHKDKAISTLKDLSNLKVGVQEGTSGDLIISKAAKKDGYTYGEGEDTVNIKIAESTTIKRYKQYALALADLKAGRIDAILMDKLPAQTMLALAD